MTRRTFAGLLFGMGYSFDKAVRKSNITKEAANDELMKHGHAEWMRRTGRTGLKAA